MTDTFQEVPLGKLLTRVERFEKRNDLEEYHFAGTYSFARGIFSGETKLGSTFRLDRIQRIHQSDFVYCKIMAWEGAFGLVPAEAHNCVMSGAFVVYEIDQTRIDPDYLRFFFMISRVWKSIGAQSTGTNVRRRSLHPNQFESSMIPLPPLAEQRRIVARIKELTTKIDEAYSLRQGIANDLPILFSGIYHQVLEGLHCETSSLGIVAEKKTGVAYKAEDFFEEKGVPVVRLKEITTKRITVYLRNPDKYQNVWLQENDIVLAKTSFSTGAICMWPGPKAVLNQNAIMLRAKPGLQQRFLFVWLKDQVSWYLRQRLADPNFYPYIREKDIMTWRVPIPSPDEQERILRYLEIQQAKIDQLERLQAKTSMDLNALRASIVDELLTGRTAPRNRQDQDTL